MVIEMKSNEGEVQSILVIDDDPDDFLLVQDAVKHIDPAIDVYFAGSCEEAVPFDNKIDLVLLDINMPGRDGFYCLRLIRGKGFRNLPIVMYTNSVSPFHITRAYNDGANLYYVKPDNFGRLINGLSKLLRLDWTNPDKVREKYQEGDKYLTFD
jgi:CheY-like chemotaxis protein